MAVFAIYRDPSIASKYLQEKLNLIQNWLKFWRIRINENKSVHITFTMHAAICPAVYLNGTHISQIKDIKYLGIHLDRQTERSIYTLNVSISKDSN
jgi:hypothetical protein